MHVGLSSADWGIYTIIRYFSHTATWSRRYPNYLSNRSKWRGLGLNPRPLARPPMLSYTQTSFSISLRVWVYWVWVYWCFTSHATIFQLYTCMWRHRCASGLKKKLYIRSGSQRHRHFVGFFNVPVLHRHGTTLFIRLSAFATIFLHTRWRRNICFDLINDKLTFWSTPSCGHLGRPSDLECLVARVLDF